MSNTTSNPMSDYDFAEIPEQINEEVLNMDPSIRSVLSRFNLDTEVIENFARSSIMYNQFSALDNDDLISLGVTDSETQEEMLAEFKTLDGQEVHLSALLRRLNDQSLERRETSVIDMIQNQLVGMNTLLAATILKVGASKTAKSPGVVINDQFNSPEVVMSVLQQMSTNVDSMMKLIKKLKNENDEKEEEPKSKLKGIAWSSFLIVSGIVISFCIFKQLRSGKQLL